MSHTTRRRFSLIVAIAATALVIVVYLADTSRPMFAMALVAAASMEWFSYGKSLAIAIRGRSSARPSGRTDRTT